MDDDPPPLERFRALVLGDSDLQLALYQAADDASFVALALEAARRNGIALTPAMLQCAPDPLGLSRRTLTPVMSRRWPPPDWLPIAIAQDGRGLAVDWAYFGDARLDEPFFELSIRRALRQPLNRLVRYRTSLEDLTAGAIGEDGAPQGFIFHLSRCGSTLVAQMLAAMPGHSVISEAPPINDILLNGGDERNARALAAIVRAYCRKRTGEARKPFVKLDSWHVLFLPLFRRAFPDVPWVFLYREPLEVLVSQQRRRGLQAIPGVLAPSVFGIDAGDASEMDAYCALVLKSICRAAAEHFKLGGGILVHYRELPEAVVGRILPHFGARAREADREAMRRVARYDVKTPHREFSSDGEDKQREASEALRRLAETHVAEAYARLEVLRQGQPPRSGAPGL
jgi:hypothetical protein